MDSAQRDVLIQTYADGPRRLREAVNAAPKAMRKWRPKDGEFSVHEVAVHCADSETNSHGRIRFLVASDDATIYGYDPDVWASKFSYHDLPLETALLTVDAVRANTVPILRRFSEEDWASTGTHTESGAYTAEYWLRTYAAHLEQHVLQIQNVIADWEAARKPAV